MEKIDRRIRRTRKLLAQAVIELVAERDYDAITIRDITERADIGYATFFRHYESKDDLMLAALMEITGELESLARQAADAHTGDYFQREGYLIFKHVKENSALYRGLLNSQWSRHLIRKLSVPLVARIQIYNQQYFPADTETAVPVDIAVFYCVQGVFSLIDWWLEHDMSYPPEEMAKIYDRLVIQGTWHVVSPENETHLPWDAARMPA